MKKKGLIIVLFFLVAIICAVIIYFWTFRKSELSVSSKKADYEIKAAQLIHDFETDEQVANEKYLGKILIVDGELKDITEDSLSITLSLGSIGDISGILCSFDKSVIEPGKVQKGQQLKVKGICTGYLLDVVLNKCSIEK